MPLLEMHDPSTLTPTLAMVGSAYITLARACGSNKHEAMPYHCGLIQLDALDQEA